MGDFRLKCLGIAIVALFALLSEGCERKTVLPGTGIVLIKVWVVLGNGESIGGAMRVAG